MSHSALTCRMLFLWIFTLLSLKPSLAAGFKSDIINIKKIQSADAKVDLSETINFNTPTGHNVIPFQAQLFNTDFIANPLNISMLFNALLLGGYFILFRKQRNLRSVPENTLSAPEFDELEKELLLKIYSSPGGEISLNQVDLLLGTSAKSLDQRNKRRSSVIRTINSKYFKITNDTAPLIASLRLKNDRRMHHYKLNNKRFRTIETYIKTED